MAINPMPYGGSDVVELTRQPTASGNRSNTDAEERRTFRVGWNSRNAFLAAMLNVATLPDAATMVCQSASYRGEGPGAILDAGRANYQYAVVELSYRPIQLGTTGSGNDVTVAWEESTDYGTEVIALPTRMWKRYDGPNGKRIRPIPDASVGYAYAFLRRVYTIKGLSPGDLPPAAIVQVQNKINSAGMLGVQPESVRLSEVRTQQTYLSDGTSKINATIGVDIRKESWNKFYFPEIDAWDYYYLDTDFTKKYEQYDTANLQAFLAGLGVTAL